MTAQAAAASSQRYRPSIRTRVTESPWLLLLPALIPVVLFSVCRWCSGIYLGFTDSRPGAR